MSSIQQTTKLSVGQLKPLAVLLPLVLFVLGPWIWAEERDGLSELKRVESFASITQENQRSIALFMEAGKVLQHARCINCHPAGDHPRQGDEGMLHQPPVTRGERDNGVVGMSCNACHQTANFDPGRVPGAPNWHLAPREMAWEGRSLREICEQIKDPLRNGGRDLEKIVHHMNEDPLVGWAWDPGADREPAPGTQKIFAALIAAWVETGAVCPSEGS